MLRREEKAGNKPVQKTVFKKRGTITAFQNVKLPLSLQGKAISPL